MTLRHLTRALPFLVLTACGEGAAKLQPLLVERTAADAGIDFVHVTGAVGNRELPETMGAGVAALDADGDGDQDLYFAQSGPLRTPAGDESRVGAENALFLNQGDATFERAPEALGAGDAGYGQGVAASDVDGDGRTDLVVLNWGPNALLLNGEGGFTPADSAAYPRGDGWSIGATFADVDGDGDLDLYEVDYVQSPAAAHTNPKIHTAAPAPFALYPHPDIFKAAPDRLLINDGAGHFTDETAARGCGGPAGKGLGVVATDVELDGWIDVYVTNDSTPNFLLHNQGDGIFVESGRTTGLAFNDDGMTEAGMGVDTADVDLDGDLDLFCTNLDVETNTLYLNSGRSNQVSFRDRTRAAGLFGPSRAWVGFGTLFGDVDLDGIADLVVANGHIIDNVADLSDTRSFAQPNQLFRGRGDGTFEELDAKLYAPGFDTPTVSRGLISADLNGDLVSDWVVTNSAAAPQLFLGVLPAPVPVRLVLDGPPGNPSGLGATVFATLTDGTTRILRVDQCGSYASSREAAISLPPATASLEVLWPGGRRTRHEIPADATLLRVSGV